MSEPTFAKEMQGTAAALGDDWCVEFERENACRLIRGPLSLSVVLFNGRYQISMTEQVGPQGERYFHHHRPPPCITVSGRSRGKIVAGHIRRRLLPDVLPLVDKANAYIALRWARYERQERMGRFLSELSGRSEFVYRDPLNRRHVKVEIEKGDTRYSFHCEPDGSLSLSISGLDPEDAAAILETLSLIDPPAEGD